MEAAKELYVKQSEIRKSILRSVKNFTKQGSAKITAGAVKARRDTLKEHYEQFRANHNTLWSVVPEETKVKEDYFLKNISEEVETEYLAALGYYLDLLEPTEQSVQKENDEYKGAVERVEKIPLPQIQLPTFSGSFLEWEAYRDLFTSLVRANASLTDVQKLHYLKTTVSGEAEKLIKNIPLTAANHEVAWAKLVKRFESTRKLVQAHLKSLFSIPAMKHETASEIKALLDGTNEEVTALKNLQRPTDQWDDILVHITVDKLDPTTRKDWETGSTSDLPTFTELEAFLDRRIRGLENVDASSDTKGSNHKQTSNSGQHRKSHESKAHLAMSATRQCSLCQGKHTYSYCPTFKKKPADQRRQVVSQLNACMNCLKLDHKVDACPSEKHCQLCSQRHHTMLHPRKEKQPPTTGTFSIQQPNNEWQPQGSQTTFVPSNVSAHIAEASASSTILLATAIVQVRSPNGTTARLRALVDPGAEATFIASSVAERLNLPRQRTSVAVSGLGTASAGTSKSQALLILESEKDKQMSLPVNALTLPKLTGLIPSKHVSKNLWPHLTGLTLADEGYHHSTRVDLILGADVYGRLLLDGLRKGPQGTPTAQNTVFGWILTGPTSTDCNRSCTTTTMPPPSSALAAHTSINADLNKTFRRFCELEEVPTTRILTDDELACEKHYQETHFRDDGRYVVRLPFRSDAENELGESRNIAVTMFLRQERSLQKKPELLDQYQDFMLEYERLGHMELVPESSRLKPPNYYMPHHAVIRDSSTTTKLRVVFNASQKTTSGTSLNETLHIGPRLQRDLPAVLLRWRTHEIVFAADITKMYRQIRIHSDDADWQRIVWRSDPNDDIKDDRLLTVTYGTASAPYLALKTLQQLATDERETYPVAASILEQDFYVDDLLSGSHDVESALEKQTGLIKLLERGKLVLRKWASNRDALLNHIPREDRAHGPPKTVTPDENIRTLGLVWHPTTDQFAYQIDLPDVNKAFTKRMILSDSARLFDPLGLLSPVTVTAKILLQDLWIDQTGWDSPLSEEIQNKWLNYRQGLKDIELFRINRWLGSNRVPCAYEIHGFCDASRRAYGAAVYIRVVRETEVLQISLLIAKTKVAPIKEVCIPRLELCGAVLLTRLVSYVENAMNLKNSPIHLWTDARVVLAWISSHPSRWKPFVANRVSEIQTSQPRASWRHISGLQNPADLTTRGIAPHDLQTNSLWWHGPEWLKLSTSQWPRLEPSKESPMLEERETIRGHPVQAREPCDLLDRYSSLVRLQRITALCIRFINRLKNPEMIVPSYITAPELNHALQVLTKMVQELHFSRDLKAIKERRLLPKDSQLKTLTPFVDNDEVLRLGGRLEHSLLPYEAKHPIILPTDSPLTELIIADAHLSTLHGGSQLTTAYLRRRFWIINARNPVRAHIHRCIRCVRQRPIMGQQLMGNLPAERIQPSRAFTHTGLDYAGPVYARASKGRGQKAYKAWIALFVCLVTRAVHLEVVSDCTTESFLNAFARFTSRRGLCSTIWSDNATTFRAADVDDRRWREISSIKG